MKDKTGSNAAQSPAGKVGGEVLLLLVQERDTVVPGSVQVRVHARRLPDRHDTERRRQGGGHEGIRSHPVNVVRHSRGDHRHAGRETTHDAAKEAWIDLIEVHCFFLMTTRRVQ